MYENTLTAVGQAVRRAKRAADACAALAQRMPNTHGSDARALAHALRAVEAAQAYAHLQPGTQNANAWQAHYSHTAHHAADAACSEHAALAARFEAQQARAQRVRRMAQRIGTAFAMGARHA